MQQQKHRGILATDFTIEHLYIADLLSVKRDTEGIIEGHGLFLGRRAVWIRSSADQRSANNRCRADDRAL